MGFDEVSDGGIQTAVNGIDKSSVQSGDVVVPNYGIASAEYSFSESASDHEVSVAATGDTLLPYVMPKAEYMYGCSATAVGMLLGYYDLYGFTVDGIHYDSSEFQLRGLAPGQSRCGSG